MTGVPVREFLATAKVLGVGLGLAEDRTLKLLGAPEAQAPVPSGGRLLRYGWLQVTVADGHVVHIAIELPGTDAQPTPLDLEAETGPYELIRVLRSLGVMWQIDQTLTFGHQLCIRTSTGILVLFDLEHQHLQAVTTATWQ